MTGEQQKSVDIHICWMVYRNAMIPCMMPACNAACNVAHNRMLACTVAYKLIMSCSMMDGDVATNGKEHGAK